MQDNARRALVSIARFDEGIATRLTALLLAEDSAERVRIHACRALMHLHCRHADTLRTALFATGATGKLRREWVRATVDGWSDPDGSWENDRDAVVECLVRAFAAPDADTKMNAAWVASRVGLHDRQISQEITALLDYTEQDAKTTDRVRLAARNALALLTKPAAFDGKTRTATREPAGGHGTYNYLGEVLHYWPKARAALVDLAQPLAVGDDVIVLSRTPSAAKTVERFRQRIESMQVEGRPLHEASSGMSVAVALNNPVHVGDRIYADRTTTGR